MDILQIKLCGAFTRHRSLSRFIQGKGFLILEVYMKSKHKIYLSVSIILIFILLFPLGVYAKNNIGLKIFHDNWVSDREVPDQDPIHQILKLRCNVNKSYCKMRLIVEESRSCTEEFGEPTDAMLIGQSEVQVVDNTIEISVDAYCLSHPPTFSFSFPVYYTYNEVNDTLIDNIGAVWYRK